MRVRSINTIFNRALPYIMMVLFLAVSGGEYFYIMHGKIFVSLFLLLSVCYHCWKFGKIRLNKSFPFFAITILYFLVHYYVIYPVHTVSTFLPRLLLLIGTYFFLSSFQFGQFKKYYLDTVSVMAVISIIIYALVETGFVQPSLIQHNNQKIMMFLCHTVGWSDLFGRLAGIFWEPGAYQIVLNLVLLLYIKELSDFALSKKQIIKLAIVVVAILLTQSTAGYICLALLASYFGIRQMISKGISFKSVALIGCVALGAFYLLTSSVLQDKLAQEGAAGSSYEVRLADNLAMIQMIKEKPLLGFGLDSAAKDQRSYELDNLTSSNGILAILSTYGILYFLFYVVFLFKGLRHHYSRMETVIVFMLFLILNLFEVYWYFPLAYVFFMSSPGGRTLKKRPKQRLKDGKEHIGIKQDISC